MIRVDVDPRKSFIYDDWHRSRTVSAIGIDMWAESDCGIYYLDKNDNYIGISDARISVEKMDELAIKWLRSRGLFPGESEV